MPKKKPAPQSNHLKGQQTIEKPSIKKRFANMLDLPKDIALNLPQLSLVGSEEMQIENYKGIIEYTDEMVRISTESGILKLEGKRLYLKHITADNITVTGKISKIEYL